MHLRQMHGAAAGMWILAAGLVGLLGNVTSIGGAAVVLGFGLVPPVLLMLTWLAPAQVVAVRPRQVNP